MPRASIEWGVQRGGVLKGPARGLAVPPRVVRAIPARPLASSDRDATELNRELETRRTGRCRTRVLGEWQTLSKRWRCRGQVCDAARIVQVLLMTSPPANHGGDSADLTVSFRSGVACDTLALNTNYTLYSTLPKRGSMHMLHELWSRFPLSEISDNYGWQWEQILISKHA